MIQKCIYVFLELSAVKINVTRTVHQKLLLPEMCRLETKFNCLDQLGRVIWEMLLKLQCMSPFFNLITCTLWLYSTHFKTVFQVYVYYYNFYQQHGWRSFIFSKLYWWWHQTDSNATLLWIGLPQQGKAWNNVTLQMQTWWLQWYQVEVMCQWI